MMGCLAETCKGSTQTKDPLSLPAVEFSRGCRPYLGACPILPPASHSFWCGLRRRGLCRNQFIFFLPGKEGRVFAQWWSIFHSSSEGPNLTGWTTGCTFGEGPRRSNRTSASILTGMGVPAASPWYRHIDFLKRKVRRHIGA